MMAETSSSVHPTSRSTFTAFLRSRPWCTDQWAGAMTPTRPGLGDADVVRASQLQHAVEHVDCHVHLSGPTLLRVRAQLIPDHALVPADRGLGPGSFRVAGRFLPSHPALLGDKLKMAVALGRLTSGRLAWHGR